MARGRPFRFDDLGGGVDLKNSDYLVDSSRARDLLNVVSLQRGAIKRRDGAVSFYDAGAAVTDVFAVEATTSGRLLITKPTGLVALDSTGASVATAALTPGRFDWASAPAISGQGPALGMDGTVARYFDGTAFGTWTASAGSLPIGKYLTTMDNRVLVAGVAASRSSVFASDIGNPRAWDTTADAWETQLDPSDGADLSAIGRVGPYTLVFKPTKTFVIYDSDTGANRRIGEGVGCVAHRSLAESPYGTFFLGEDGVHVTDGNRVERISDLVDPLLENIVAAHRSEAAGIYFNDRYYLSICTTGTTNNLTLEYDPRRKAWWIHTLASPQWAPWHRTGAPELMGATGNKALRAFVAGTTDDLGVAYTGFWKSGWHAFGVPYLRKRCRAVHFDGEGVFDFYIGKDFSVGDTLWSNINFTLSDDTFGGAGLFGGDGLFGGGDATDEAKVYTLGVARAWSAIFSSTQPFEIDSYTLFMTERKN